MITILRFLQYNFKSAIGPVIVAIYCSGFLANAQTSSFLFDFDYACAPTVVTLTNTSSTGSGYEYLWDFGKGAVIPSDEITLYEAYTQPGNYTITLAVVNGSDTIRSSQEIYIAAGPHAAFSADPVEGCTPHTVTFTDNSSAGDAVISEVFWDFRDGQTRTGQTIDYTYTQAGTSNVFMRVTDVNGCTDYREVPDLIIVNPAPIVEFSATDSFACDAPFSVSFMNLSEGSGELQSFWNFGNGNTSYNFSGQNLYTANGSYDVSLRITDENDCTDSLIKESFINIGSENGDLYVLINEQQVFDPNTILCQGELTFGSTFPRPPGFTWIVDYNGEIQTFINEQEIVINAADSGYINHTMYSRHTAECPDSVSKQFHIDYVRADFDMDRNYTCSLPIDLTLSNTSENDTEIRWFLPDGTTDDQDTVTTTVDGDLTYEELYSHNVNYRNTPILLIATNENGCQDTLVRDLDAMLPVARTMPDVTNGCIPFEVEFSDSSRSAEPIIEWTYMIDDQIFTQTDDNPFLYTFENPGNHEIRLALENDLGCRDTSYAIIIHAGEKLFPSLSVDPTSICFGNTIQLNSDDPPPGLVDLWQYSSAGLFNTGPLFSPNTSVTVYPASQGSKDIQLTVESNYCVSDTTFADVFTVKGPTGYFDYNFSCDSPLVYTFVSHIENADGLVWTIGTDVFTDIDSFTYVFTGTGDFAVRLYAANSGTGCSMEKSRLIKVRNVHADFIAEPFPCVGVETEFNASASIDYINDCFIEGFLWNFGDETPPRRNYYPIQTHVYSEEGIYYPWLEVTADNGCVDTLKTSVNAVLSSADFSADPDSGCGPELDVNFNYDGLDETISSWIWLFGDMSLDSSNNPSPVHRYSGLFDTDFMATLVATDQYGCQNYTQQIIHISSPDARFQAVDPGLCIGQEAVFIPLDSDLSSYLWDYGDGSPAGSSNTHIYDETGTYSVSLTVTKYNCSANSALPDYISVEQADASYTVSDSLPDCYPATITFNHSGTSGVVAAGTWRYSLGVQSSTYNPITEYTYSQPGTYNTSLTIQTMNNCVASASKTIEVSGPQADFVFSPLTICNGDTVRFSIIESEELDEFEWIFGDGNVSSEIDPEHVYFGEGIIFPALRVVKDNCEVTLPGQGLQIVNPHADFTTLNQTGIHCIDAALSTINESAQFDESLWFVDEIEVSNNTNLQDHYFQDTGEHTITLKIYNSTGCFDSISQIVDIVSLPVFEIYGDTSICPGIESAQLQVNEQPGWSISWQPANILNDPSVFDPVAQPPVTTEIFAMVEDENFCRDTQSITIFVRDIPDIQRKPIADTSIIIGESLQLFIQSDIENTLYSWSPMHSISCSSCQDPFVNPTEDITYTVLVQDECFEFSYDFNIEVIINFYLELPKAFTPNGDEVNDIFHFEANNLSTVDFKIFNRWGNLVFSTHDLNQGWDGRHNGKLQNPDTYTYYIRAVSDHGFEFERKGTFLLLR